MLRTKILFTFIPLIHDKIRTEINILAFPVVTKGFNS